MENIELQCIDTDLTGKWNLEHLVTIQTILWKLRTSLMLLSHGNSNFWQYGTIGGSIILQYVASNIETHKMDLLPNEMSDR